jgi:hypothetical protein
VQLQADVSARARVVVDRYRNGDAVALGKRDGEIEIDEEILEDLDARCAAAQPPRVVEAIIAMRQVVMESAMGMAMVALPCWSVTISELI